MVLVMKNNLTVEEYVEIHGTNKKSKFYIILLGIIIIGIIFIIYKFDFKVYSEFKLMKKDNEYLFILNSEQLELLKKQKTIYINQTLYRYKIKRIEEDYTVIDNEVYQSVYIDPYNYKQESVITKCSLLISDNTILEMIIEFMKGV